MNYRNLIALFAQRGAPAQYDPHAPATVALREAWQADPAERRNLDLGRLFAECFGWHHFASCRAGNDLAANVMDRALTEAEGAVATSAFLNVSGQFVYQTVLDAYQSEEFVFSRLIPESPASTLDGEKIPGITEIGDELAVRGEGEPYGLAGVGENWQFTPAIKDRGLIIPVTWEAVFNDKTGRLLERCADTGRWAGQNREKHAIDAVVDENTTAHRHNWRGNVIASYDNNTGNHTFDNLAAGNALADHTDLDAAEQLFNGMTDPFTGEPIVIEPKHLVVCKELELTALRVLNSTELRTAVGGYATTGNPATFIQDNPYRGRFQLLTSRLLATRMATDTSWFLGDVARLARCMVAEPLQTLQAPANAHEEFHRRIVQQYRVNYRMQYYVIEPRASVKSTVA